MVSDLAPQIGRWLMWLRDERPCRGNSSDVSLTLTPCLVLLVFPTCPTQTVRQEIVLSRRVCLWFASGGWAPVICPPAADTLLNKPETFHCKMLIALVGESLRTEDCDGWWNWTIGLFHIDERLNLPQTCSICSTVRFNIYIYRLIDYCTLNWITISIPQCLLGCGTILYTCVCLCFRKKCDKILANWR